VSAKVRTTPPLFNDPVVVDGRKYRIYAIRPSAGTAVLHDRYGGAGRPNGPMVELASLVWDPIAGVWRIQP
jgi:hypothetical protein